MPAGAVRGRVLNRDGTPAADDVRVGTRVEFHYSPQRWTSFGINNVPVDLQGEFFLSPVPIGADKDLVICASRGHENALSRPVRVDAENVSPVVELRFSLTQSASGLVVGPGGDPRGASK